MWPLRLSKCSPWSTETAVAAGSRSSYRLGQVHVDHAVSLALDLFVDEGPVLPHEDHEGVQGLLDVRPVLLHLLLDFVSFSTGTQTVDKPVMSAFYSDSQGGAVAETFSLTSTFFWYFEIFK